MVREVLGCAVERETLSKKLFEPLQALRSERWDGGKHLDRERFVADRQQVCCRQEQDELGRPELRARDSPHRCGPAAIAQMWTSLPLNLD